MKVNQSNINPVQVLKNLESLKVQTEEFKKAQTEFLKGRNIQQVEADAVETLKAARVEALRIKSQADLIMREANKSKARCDEALMRADSKEMEIDKLKLDAEKDRSLAAQFKSEHDIALTRVENAIGKAEEERVRYAKNLQHLKDTVNRFEVV